MEGGRLERGGHHKAYYALPTYCNQACQAHHPHNAQIFARKTSKRVFPSSARPCLLVFLLEIRVLFLLQL